ncbi:hypothetical protein ACFE04_017394 [Oxalis oulophora]
MSSSDHQNNINMQTKPPPPTSSKEENNRKTRPPQQEQQQILIKCPRCDSPNTKFCYYNNYSLTQPRHFCKTCRRYWTKGGALRNVPIGGGCRKNKKMIKSSSSSSSRFSDNSSSSSDMNIVGGLKFFNGLSPAMDFNLGGLSSLPLPSPSFPRVNNSNYNQLMTSYGDHQGFDLSGNNSAGSNLLGFNNYNPLISSMGALNVNSSLASSIESLSSINQDLHWKLQQQRLAQNKPQPISFQNLEISKPISTSGGVGGGGGSHQTTTEWFFGNCYNAPVTANNPAQSSGGPAFGNENTTNNNWNGSVQTWSTGTDLHQYTTLP